MRVLIAIDKPLKSIYNYNYNYILIFDANGFSVGNSWNPRWMPCAFFVF